MPMHEGGGFLVGRLHEDATALERRGWLVGFFMPEGDPRKVSGFEVKFHFVEPGERTHELKVDGAVDFNILLDGTAVGVFDGEEKELAARLDDPDSWIYAVVSPGVVNAFPRHARTRLIMLCVKSPSVPGLKQVVE